MRFQREELDQPEQAVVLNLGLDRAGTECHHASNRPRGGSGGASGGVRESPKPPGWARGTLQVTGRKFDSTWACVTPLRHLC